MGKRSNAMGRFPRLLVKGFAILRFPDANRGSASRHIALTRDLTDVTYSAWKIWRNRVQSRNFLDRRHAAALERLPYTWNHEIEKESLRFKKFEHVKLEKVDQLF